MRYSGIYQLVSDPKPRHSVVARLFTTNDGLASNQITALCQTADGKLWAGTTNGLCEFITEDPKIDRKFRNYSRSDGLSDQYITTVVEDRNHSLWMGSVYGGAMRLAVHGFTTYSLADGLGGVKVSMTFNDQDGRLMVVTADAHLNRFDGSRFTAARITLPKGLTYWGWGWYQVMFQDSRGEWWMSTGQGLVRYPRLERLEHITGARPKATYTTRDGLPSNEIFRIFEDSRGDIWISTLGNANLLLARWERATETFHGYTPDDNIPREAPTAFCEDTSGNLWMGLYNGGLLRYAQGRFTLFTEAGGVVQPGCANRRQFLLRCPERL
jgi:ligand-binding sensor domain-containing protein